MSIRMMWQWLLVVCAAAAACSDSSPANRPPLLAAPQVTTEEDTPIDIDVLAGTRDLDGDPLTVAEPSAGGHGAEIVGSSIVRVSPRRDFHGTIEVSYKVSDGTRVVNGHAVVTVRPINDAPVAFAGTQSIHRTAELVLRGSDVDGDVLTYEVVGGPVHGTLKGNLPVLVYTAEGGFLGDDAITYRVLDGTVASEPATIQLHVVPGSAPVAISESARSNEDVPLNLVLHASDPDSDPLTYTIVTLPAHGTLSGAAPNLVYTPARDFSGGDSLTFSVDDGYGPSPAATITISVTPVNDAPVAAPQTVAATEDSTQQIRPRRLARKRHRTDPDRPALARPRQPRQLYYNASQRPADPPRDAAARATRPRRVARACVPHAADGPPAIEHLPAPERRQRLRGASRRQPVQMPSGNRTCLVEADRRASTRAGSLVTLICIQRVRSPGPTGRS